MLTRFFCRKDALTLSEWRGRITLAIIILMSFFCLGLILCILLKLRNQEQKMICKQRLQRLGLALGGYNENYYAFPYGTVPNPALLPRERLSWIVSVAPYFQGGPDPIVGIRMDKSWEKQINFSVGKRTFPKLLICPSRGGDRTEHGLGLTTYVGIAGIGASAVNLTEDALNAGVFGYDRQTWVKSITDGVSYTALVAETNTLNGPWIAGGLPTVRGLENDAKDYLGRNRQFGGLHSGGGNVLFVDTSVHFLDNSIDPKVFEALATIHGGESVHLGDW